MVNKKHIPQGYKDSSLGIIPEGWEVKMLREISEISSGATPSRNKEEFWNGNIPWVTTTLLNDSKIWSTEENISEEGLKKTATRLLTPGTILMAMYGQGKTRGLVSILMIAATTNQACAAVSVNDHSNNYIFYQLQYRYEQIRNLSNDGNQKNLSLGIIGQIEIPIPPLSIQLRIAEILSCWDEAIEKQTQLIEKLEIRKRGLMQQLLSGKKREQGSIGGWRKYHLGSLGETYNGLSGKNKSDFGVGKPYIPYLNVFSNSKIDKRWLEYVKVESEENQYKVRYGDILFTVSSETPEEVGMASVMLDSIDELYLNSFCFGFRLLNFEVLLPEFCRYYFRASAFRQEIFRLSQGATRYNLSKKSMMGLFILIPSIEEQTLISNILSTIDEEIETGKDKLFAFKSQKKGLMQQLLTGKKRVKTIN